jgi:hypothetical protein
MQQTFVLGVDSQQTALDACMSLSFAAIEAGEISLPSRIRVLFGRVDEGVIVSFQGEFTDEERREILLLGKYDDEGTRPEVIGMVTDLTKRLASEGAGANIHILSKADAGESDS